jgi:hypothetical protein
MRRVLLWRTPRAAGPQGAAEQSENLSHHAEVVERLCPFFCCLEDVRFAGLPIEAPGTARPSASGLREILH